MRHFIRLGGELLQVYPLTKPHRERSDVHVYAVRYQVVIVTDYRDIIIDY